MALQGDGPSNDRMTRLLRTAFPNGDVRELVLQTHSSLPSHASSNRPTPTQIAALYEVDETVAVPEPATIIIADDILTAGCHFVAMLQVLRRRFPAASFAGVFLARRIFP